MDVRRWYVAVIAVAYLAATVAFVVATLEGGRTGAWVTVAAAVVLAVLALASSSFVRALVRATLRKPRESSMIEREKTEQGSRWTERAPSEKSSEAENSSTDYREGRH